MNMMPMLPDPSDTSRQNAVRYIQEICADFGLYGNIISYISPTVPESDRNREYLIAGIDPSIGSTRLPENIQPEKILRQIRRSDKFFYPQVWVYDLSDNSDQMRVTQDLSTYCDKANFIRQLYTMYDTPVPDVLRESEIGQLSDAWDALHHPNSNAGLAARANKDLTAFFKREKDPSKKEWLQYFRSDRFPDDGGKISKLMSFGKRDDQIVSTEQLMEFNSNINKLQMQEHEFKIFRELMAKAHPDCTYAIGKLEIVDHELIDNHNDPDNPFGKAVTGEEYAVIRKERFAAEGWEALKSLKMAYWEFRDVYYKAVDEPLIASVYNKITLEYAKSDPIADLLNRGSIHLVKIPADDFMNFVSLAKANDLRFHIDTDGIYSVPSLDHVSVIYNTSQTSLLQAITGRMMNDKSTNMSFCMPLETRLSGIQLSDANPSSENNLSIFAQDNYRR